MGALWCNIVPYWVTNCTSEYRRCHNHIWKVHYMSPCCWLCKLKNTVYLMWSIPIYKVVADLQEWVYLTLQDNKFCGDHPSPSLLRMLHHVISREMWRTKDSHMFSPYTEPCCLIIVPIEYERTPH